jgi:hypothetical protein
MAKHPPRWHEGDGECTAPTQEGCRRPEVEHRRLFLDVPAKGAKLDITVETRDPAHAETVLRALAADGFAPARIEMATALE